MLNDVRLAIRRFRFNPTHTLAMIVVLGLGIGATTAIFSVVDQTILRPAPFSHADRLVDVMGLVRKGGGGGNILTPQKILGWQAQQGLFERFEGYAPREFDLSSRDTEPQRVQGLLISTGLFSMLGVRPILGRDFARGDGTPGGERTVIISEILWRRAFGGQPAVLGSVVALSDQPYTVVGVMPRRFRLTGDKEMLWLPVDLDANVTSPAARNFAGIGRLSTAVRRGTEQDLADAIADRLQADQPLPDSWTLRLEPKKVAYVNATTRKALFVLLGAVGFVLLIACANTAHLFLSQVAVRQREMAVRTAIGASRVRLLREVLTESLLLAACGGTLGLLFATWGIDGILAAAPPNLASSATTPIELDVRVMAVSAALALATGIVFGLVPAIRGSRPSLDVVLKGGTAGRGVSAGGGRLSAVLVATEVAFAFVLLIGSALMIRTFANLSAIDPGFDPDGVVAVDINVPTDKYPAGPARIAFVQAIRDKLVALPAVSEVAVAAGALPGEGGTNFGQPEAEGGLSGSSRETVIIPMLTVSPEYFHTMRIPIVAGRTFTQEDGPSGAIVSQAIAEQYWPGGNAVGRRFKVFGSAPWRLVVGVAANVESRSVDGRTTRHIYYPWDTTPPKTQPAAPVARGYAKRVLLVRTANPEGVLSAIKPAVWSVDSNQPVERIARVEEVYAARFGQQRFVLQLMSAFGALAALLTAAGIFGVLSQIVGRRTREIGIRIALGARAADVLRLVVSGGAAFTCAGIAGGVAGALALTRFLESLLFEVRPVDPLSFAAVAVLMALIALVACWLPARRAVRVDPAVALRVD